MRPASLLRHLPTQLAVPTRSPWVYAVQGVDVNTTLYPPVRLEGKRAEYVTPASLNFELPTSGRPELAFTGRSNAGKSTLIGELLGSPNLVRTSKRPGCTKMVNFFALRTDAHHDVPFLYLVDLPGYGFARQSKPSVRRWTSVVQSYLGGRSCKVLRRVFVLVDSRHGPQTGDEQILALLNDAGISNQVVLTKVDKVTPQELLRSIEGTCQKLLLFPMTLPVVHCVSAHKGLGMVELANTAYSLTKSAGRALPN